MHLTQQQQLRRLLAPELRQSLNILALHLLDVSQLAETELTTNPLLEEAQIDPLPAAPSDLEIESFLPKPNSPKNNSENEAPSIDILVQKVSLQHILLRQLGMFINSDEEVKIGEEIIGNIDDNGYLKVSLEEIAAKLNLPLESIEKTLCLIQKFEPAGVGARTPAECLIIQLNLSNEANPLLKIIVQEHLDDLAKKNYSHIAKTLKKPLEEIEPLIKKILSLNPKPGRNYSLDEAQRIIPDVIIEQKDDDLEITINNDYIPRLTINKTYRDMLKQPNLDPQTREFLTNKLNKALELLRAISKRQSTLRRVSQAIVEIQREAITEDLSCMKPLTFQDVAQKLEIHESTICRVVMNKYMKTPCGVIALKSFFSSHVHGSNGESVSSTFTKKLIKDLVDQEDKKHPLSDQKISQILLKDHSLNLARRTVVKYREELKLLSSTFRKER